MKILGEVAQGLFILGAVVGLATRDYNYACAMYLGAIYFFLRDNS